MASEETSFLKKLDPQKAVAVFMLGFAAVCVVSTLSPSIRNKFRSKFFRADRKVLSIVQGNLLNDGQIVKAIKYQTLSGIVIEIFGTNENGARSLIDRIDIPGEHDGYFDFYGRAAQLAVMDLDEDGGFELVAPTFDKELVAHLNIFRYNPLTKNFEAIQPPE